MNPSLIAAMNFFLGTTKKKETQKIAKVSSKSQKAEIDKINSMDFFEAIDYVRNKKFDTES
jgi:hypothetical protein